MICGQKFNSSSGVVPKLAMICGQKCNSPSGVVPKLAMICGQKFNSLSGVVRKLAMISGRKSDHASYVARNLAMIFRHMSGKIVLASHTRLPVKAIYTRSKQPHNKVRVSVYNDVFSKILGICSLLAASTDEEIIEKILDLELVKVSYDSQNNKVIDIDQIKV